MQVDVVVFCIDKMLVEGMEKMKVIVVKMNDLKVIDRSLIWNSDLMELLELINLMLNVLVIIVVVEVCKESCGVYVYEDWFEWDDVNWCKYLFVWIEGNDVKLVYWFVYFDFLIKYEDGGIDLKKIVFKVRVY